MPRANLLPIFTNFTFTRPLLTPTAGGSDESKPHSVTRFRANCITFQLRMSTLGSGNRSLSSLSVPPIHLSQERASYASVSPGTFPTASESVGGEATLCACQAASTILRLTPTPLPKPKLVAFS